MISVKLLDDITECPICTENYKDPRSLPCVHTFCLACISKWGEDKLAGDLLDCPLCRTEFTIPASGLQQLPKNIFIGKLLAMKEEPGCVSGAQQQQLCDWCNEKKNEAKLFCVDCQENLCESCVNNHSSRKLCRSHRTIDIAEKFSDTTTACLPTKCDKHPTEDLKLFCMACKEALCFTCYATKHNKHDSAEIEQVADGLRTEMKSNISQLEDGVKCVVDSLSTIQSVRQQIVVQCEKVEAEVCARADELHSIIERHKQQLVEQITKVKEEKLKEVDTLLHEVTQNKVLMESLRKYSEELLKKGSDGDIAREVKLMNERVVEMRRLFERESVRTTAAVVVKFVRSDTELDTCCNTIGSLELSGKFFVNSIFFVA